MRARTRRRLSPRRSEPSRPVSAATPKVTSPSFHCCPFLESAACRVVDGYRSVGWGPGSVGAVGRIRYGLAVALRARGVSSSTGGAVRGDTPALLHGAVLLENLRNVEGEHGHAVLEDRNVDVGRGGDGDDDDRDQE